MLQFSRHFTIGYDPIANMWLYDSFRSFIENSFQNSVTNTSLTKYSLRAFGVYEKEVDEVPPDPEIAF